MFIFKRYIKKNLATIAMLSIASILTAQTNAPASDTIVISRNNKGITITGIITDAATKKPLLGIRVKVENFSAAITDEQGHFTLKVPDLNYTVAIEGEGYNTKQEPLKGRSTIKVALLDDSHESFSEIITMPIGAKPKTHVTEAIGQYNVNAAWSRPAEIPDALLQGKVAGLQAIRRSGAPGAGANLFLRGYNSLFGTNKPLIIIDNMLFDANDYGQSIIANNYTNPLALIDVKDIDNITVLKDAASTYGTKGANGAIIITTARAKSQATKMDFATYTGFNIAPNNLPIMKAADYRIYLSEILQSKGLSAMQIADLPYMNDDPNNPNYAQYHYNTNWQRKSLNNSMNQNYFLKVTGGDNIATYGLSLGYMNNGSSIKNTSLSRYNTRFNAEFNFSKKFTGFTNLSFVYNEQNLKDQGIANKTAPLFLSLIKAPFMTDHEVNSKGIESPNLADKDTLGISNPSAVIENMLATNKYYRFMGSFGFKYEISKYINANTVFGIVYDKVRENFFVPRKGIENDTLSNAIADSRMGTQVKRLFSFYNDTKFEYKRIFNRTHDVGLKLGVRYQQNNAEQDFALGFNSATDDLVSVQTGLSSLRQVGGNIGKWNWLNNYFAVNYGFRQKMFLNINVAMDGASRFGKEAKEGIDIGGNKFPIMYDASAAWLISSEKFMANSSINLLKLRASYGVAGNDDIGNYSSRRTYTSQNLLGAQGLVRKGIANPALQWETIQKVNAGIDVAFFNERVSFSIDAYKSKTTNMLVYEQLPVITGFENIITNNGKMNNEGIEAAINFRLINKAEIKWDFNFNIATNKNKVVTVPNGQFTTDYAGATILTANNQVANQFYGYTSKGVFVTDAEAAAAGLQKKNSDGSYTFFKGGDIRFDDVDGNKIIDDKDRTIIGNPNAAYTGGFSNCIKWKNIEFNALFTFSKGNDVYNYVRYRLESASGVENQLISVNNRWHGDGQITNMPKATWADPLGNNRFSNRWIEDGSYLRLRNLSMQYNFPLKSNTVVKSLSAYLSADNVVTLTNYKGYDPEFSVTPSVFSQGIDTGLDPIYRSITLGVKIGL